MKRGRPRTTSLRPGTLRWRIFHAAKARAKRVGVRFDLKGHDIKIPKRCPILGIPLFPGKKRATNNSPSLDRIIPELGYIAGNVHVISNRANTIKNNATRSELIKLAKWAMRHMPHTIKEL
jgi:hypothetical protein